jgi:hypothetical protein
MPNDLFNTNPQSWNGPGFQEGQNFDNLNYETPPSSPLQVRAYYSPYARSPPRAPTLRSRVRTNNNRNVSPVRLTFEDNSRVVRNVPLQLVNPPTPIPEIKSNSYPDVCGVCLEAIDGQGCRVNCPDSHIFHCNCINQWTNTPKVTFSTNDIDDVIDYVQNPQTGQMVPMYASTQVLSDQFNDTCPLCRKKITEMYHVNIPEGFKTGFGKKRNNNRSNRSNRKVSEISYLRSLIN